MQSMTDAIIDGGSLFARSYFAAQKGGKDPVSLAIRTALNMLRNERIFGYRIDRAMICWDGEKTKTIKKRPVEKPSDYIPLLKEFSRRFEEMTGVIQVKLNDYEADDVVATASEQSEASHVIVVSGDKDISQLQCQRVSFYDLHQKMVLTPRAICSRFHVHHPIQVSLALAIQGDPGDGISGVKGWGEGKVKKLFEAIPPETPFCQVVNKLLDAMNGHQQEEFLKCLDVTLLNTQIEGVPQATKVALNANLVAEFEQNSMMPWENGVSRVCNEASYETKEEAEATGGQAFACSTCLRWHVIATK
jgi:5'-3' exonuclease